MITGLNHLTLSVSDLDRSFDFYTAVLGFKPLFKRSKGAYLLTGELWFCLDEDPHVKVAASSYTHFAFSVGRSDFEDVSKKIKSSGATIWKKNKSEGESLYFLDLDGHKLEIHVGDWRSRVESYKSNPQADMKFFV